jgi:NADH-quinone oxidoreductase subunit M
VRPTSGRDLLVKRITLLTTIATLGVTSRWTASRPSPRFQFAGLPMDPQFGVHAVGVDGIALVLILMTAVLMPVVISRPGTTRRARPAGEGSNHRGAA